MENHEDHPTWHAIPAEFRSVWYRVPGFSTQLDRRGKGVLRGRGLSASTAIEGIRAIDDIAAVGDIIPFRWFDETVRQGTHLMFFRPHPHGYGIVAIEPTDDELIKLYERFPAMRPKPPRKP